MKTGMTKRRFKRGAFPGRRAMGIVQMSSAVPVVAEAGSRDDGRVAAIEPSVGWVLTLLLQLVRAWEKVSPPSALLSRGSCSARMDDMVGSASDTYW